MLIVDFFSTCDKNLQKAWKQLLVSAMPNNANSVQSSPMNFPQALELELKLLYTAITRSQNRMHFIETKQSHAFNAWNRLLKELGLAETMQLGAVVKEGAKMMTSDEWRVEGIEMALQAEDSDGDEDSSNRLERSIAHFQKAGDSKLEARARAQLQVMKQEHCARDTFFSEPSSSKAVSDGTKAIISYLNAGLVGEATRVCNEFCGPVGLTGLGGRIEKLPCVSG